MKGVVLLSNDCAEEYVIKPGKSSGQTSVIEPPAAQKSCGSILIEKPGISKLASNEGTLLALIIIVISLSFAIPHLKARGAWIGIPCLFYKLTGIPCLACGLTRSFVYTAHGRWVAAFKMHLLGPPLFFMTCALGLYYAVALIYGFRLKFNISRKTRSLIILVALGIAIAAWIIKIVYIPSSWK